MGSYLESKPRHQTSSLNTGWFILDFVVDSLADYNITTKEEKDPKGPHVINTCSTKLLGGNQNLYIHWNGTGPYRKALVIKSDVILNYLKTSNNLISCQIQSKCD